MSIFEEQLQKDRANFEPLTPVSFLRRAAQVAPSRTAIIHGQRRYSYAQFLERSSRLANSLAARGIGPGDCVAIMGANTPEMLEAHNGVPMLGAVLNSLNIRLDAKTIAFILDHGEAKALLTDRVFSEVIKEALALTAREVLVIDIDDSQSEGGECLGEMDYESFIAEGGDTFTAGQPEDEWQALSLLYTSGTTGPSKGATVCHAHAYEYAFGVTEMLALDAGDVYYAPLPLFHLAGQFAVVYASCIAGATAVICGGFSAQRYWQDIARFEANCSFLLGAMANFLYQQPRTATDQANPLERVLMVPLIPEVEDFKQRFDCRVSTTWGGTEMNCPMRAGFDLVDNKSCGRGAEDRYEVRIVDENDAEVPHGVPGEALVRTREPWIMSNGYWNHPEWTEKAFRNLWYHTGDMLMRDTEGNFYFVDRTKDAIRRRGENISSMEVENEINASTDIVECAVIPVASTHTEQDVMAVVVARDPSTFDPATLIEFLVPRLPYFMVPRYIEQVDALPKTPTGKIQKYPLRDRGLSGNTWDREAAGLKIRRC